MHKHDHTCDHPHDDAHDHEHEHHHDHDHNHPDSSHGAALWQAALIALTGIMLLVKVGSGTLPFYVHVRYTTLITGTGIVLLLLGLIQSWFILNPPQQGHTHDHDHGHDHDHSHEVLSWRSPAVLALMVPILLGLLVPAKALNSSAIETRGFGNTGTGMRTVQTIANADNSQPTTILQLDTSQWTLLDWVNGLIYQPDNPALQGKEIEVTGFVWRSEELKENQFFVARFIVSCCTADSLAIYLPVISPDSPDLIMDSWVRIKGTVRLADVQGEEVAVIEAAEIIPIEQPAQPYLYP